MMDLFRKTALAGLGAAVLTREKIEEAIGELVKRGEMNEDVGQKLVRDLIKRGEDGKREAETLFQATFSALLDKVQLATKSELESLQDQVNALRADLQSIRSTTFDKTSS